MLRTLTIYRPETQSNKLKLTLANSSLVSDFVIKMRKMTKLKLVTRMSFACYAIETSTNFFYHIENKRDVYDRYGKEGLTGGKTKFDRSDLAMVKVILI